MKCRCAEKKRVCISSREWVRWLLLLAGMSAESSFSLPAQEVSLPATTSLPVQLDHRVWSRRGARLHGHVTEPVFLVDHEVIPQGALVSGTIRSMHSGSRGEHVRRLLAGDFTPVRVPDVVFDRLTLPAVAGQTARTIVMEARAEQTNATVLRLGSKAPKQTIWHQVRATAEQKKQDLMESFGPHHLGETVEKWAIGQLPYHPELLWRETRFHADLVAPVTLPDPPHRLLGREDLRGQLPRGILRTRLITPLSSAKARRSDVVEAEVTRPLLSDDGARVLVPAGTALHGVVMNSHQARWLGRDGHLRFTFRSMGSSGTDTPSLEIHGRVSAAETVPDQKVSLDEEGQATAGDTKGKYAEPLLLGILAAGAAPDESHPGPALPGATTVSANGFGLIGRVVSYSTRNTHVLQGFAYFSLAKAIYFNLLAKGQETTFSRDTTIEVSLSER